MPLSLRKPQLGMKRQTAAWAVPWARCPSMRATTRGCSSNSPSRTQPTSLRRGPRKSIIYVPRHRGLNRSATRTTSNIITESQPRFRRRTNWISEKLKSGACGAGGHLCHMRVRMGIRSKWNGPCSLGLVGMFAEKTVSIRQGAGACSAALLSRARRYHSATASPPFHDGRIFLPRRSDGAAKTGSRPLGPRIHGLVPLPRRSCPVGRCLKNAALLHLYALQIGPDRERTGVGFFYLRDSGIEIELRDVAEHEASGVCALCDTAHHGGQSLVGIVGADTDRQMHDQEVRILGEFGEPRIGSVLIGAEHDRLALRFPPIREGWKIAVRYAERRHLDPAQVEHGRWLLFRHIDLPGIEPHDSAIRGPACHDRAEYLKGAGLLVEQAALERRQTLSGGVARLSDDRP